MKSDKLKDFLREEIRLIVKEELNVLLLELVVRKKSNKVNSKPQRSINEVKKKNVFTNERPVKEPTMNIVERNRLLVSGVINNGGVSSKFDNVMTESIKTQTPAEPLKKKDMLAPTTIESLMANTQLTEEDLID